MLRRSLLALVALGLALACRPLAAATPALRPHILYILADDLGIGDVSCYHPRSAWRTPHLDRLAREGIQFMDAHSASALCTPSRYALLTGRYAWRGALKRGVVDGYAPGLIERGRLTVPAFLRAQGYTTALVGKWHLGLDWARRGGQPEAVDYSRPFGGGPLAHGFERFFGIGASLDMPPYVWLEDDRATQVPTRRVEDSPPPRLWRAGSIADDFKMEDVQSRLIARTIDYLTERAAAKDGRPFFLYLALAAPHTPLLPSREYAGTTRTTEYGDFVAQVDADIGRVLAALDRTGLAQDTLVIVTSDNGFAPAAGLPELLRVPHDPSGGFRGYKSDLFEGGHRVPFLVRWPGRAPAGHRSTALVGQVDLFATCAELLGVALPDDAAEDSVSMLPLLTSRDAAPRRTTLVQHSGEGRFAVRQGRWKLLLWPGSGGWSSPTPAPSRWLAVPATDLAPLPKYQLYDLAADPAEKNNLAAARPELVRELGRELRASIERGRSTPGPARPVSLAGWSQLEWMSDFAP